MRMALGITKSNTASTASYHIVLATRQQVSRHSAFGQTSLRCASRDQDRRFSRIISLWLSAYTRYAGPMYWSIADNSGLTDDHPTLTTFFEGEIIGPKYLFKTTDPTWGSTEKVDLQHWARFPAWRPLAKSAKSPNFTLKNFQQRPHLFMRLKERFLVPDHKVKTINGASFEGFYYVCFDQCTGQFSGIYFHAKSEKYQQLELQHVDDHGCMGAVEFR